jgi:hypothetical protein
VLPLNFLGEVMSVLAVKKPCKKEVKENEKKHIKNLKKILKSFGGKK